MKYASPATRTKVQMPSMRRIAQKFADQAEKPAGDGPTKGSGPGDRAEAAYCGGTTVGETAAFVQPLTGGAHPIACLPAVCDIACPRPACDGAFSNLTTSGTACPCT